MKNDTLNISINIFIIILGIVCLFFMGKIVYVMSSFSESDDDVQWIEYDFGVNTCEGDIIIRDTPTDPE